MPKVYAATRKMMNDSQIKTVRLVQPLTYNGHVRLFTAKVLCAPHAVKVSLDASRNPAFSKRVVYSKTGKAYLWPRRAERVAPTDDNVDPFEYQTNPVYAFLPSNLYHDISYGYL